MIKKLSNFYLTVIVITLFFWANNTEAQTKYSGFVLDNTLKGIQNASILIKDKKGFVVFYNSTDSLGLYKINILNELTQDYTIEVIALGYFKTSKPIIENKFKYDFILEEQSILLEEVVIKKRPQITSKGDTLSYNVESFARAEDRSIGDVIRRLPGVTVAENGQISFNGKVISNLYIQGDDLMDGRYGLATKVINKDMVESVDIMQNHQPIKVLKDKVFTDDVAVNLILKDELKLNLGGQIKVGLGFPEQFDTAINGIVFNKKIKMLNAIQGNNSGIDYSNDIEQIGVSLGSRISFENTPPTLLSVSTAGSPNLPKNAYYLNKSGMLNTNNLYNFNNGMQVKSNLQFFIDKNNLTYNGLFSNFLVGDTINYSEAQLNINKPTQLNLALTATQNKKTYFLNNRFNFNIGLQRQIGELLTNGIGIEQSLNVDRKTVSNNLSYIPSLSNGNLIELNWAIKYFENPHNLRIDTGLNDQILNQGVAFKLIDQFVSIPSFTNNISSNYRVLNSGVIKQNYQIGILSEWQKLNSELSLGQNNGTSSNYLGDDGNQVTWTRNRVSLTGEYTFKNETWEAGLTFPFAYQNIDYAQKNIALKENKVQFLITPSANLRMFINSEDYIKASYNFQNVIGTIAQVFPAAILTNYRSIKINDAGLQQQNIHSSSLYYNFQRSVVMFFMNFGLSYKIVSANSILSSTINDQIEQTVVIPLNNNQNSLTANIGMSKYLFAINTTLKLGYRWSNSHYSQFVNNQRLPFDNQLNSVNMGLNGKLFKKLTVDYNALYSLSKSRVREAVNKLESNVTQIEQGLNLGYSPKPLLDISVEGKHIYNRQSNISNTNYIFINAQTRYRVKAWKTDLSFELTNLMNIKTFESLQLSSNQFNRNTFDLRGRMGILRATFIF